MPNNYHDQLASGHTFLWEKFHWICTINLQSSDIAFYFFSLGKQMAFLIKNDEAGRQVENGW